MKAKWKELCMEKYQWAEWSLSIVKSIYFTSPRKQEYSQQKQKTLDPNTQLSKFCQGCVSAEVISCKVHPTRAPGWCPCLDTHYVFVSQRPLWLHAGLHLGEQCAWSQARGVLCYRPATHPTSNSQLSVHPWWYKREFEQQLASECKSMATTIVMQSYPAFGQSWRCRFADQWHYPTHLLKTEQVAKRLRYTESGANHILVIQLIFTQ